MNVVSFSAGTALTWSSPMLDKLSSAGNENPFDRGITEDEGSWISSLLSLGAAFGPFIYGNLTRKIGRKYTLLGTGIPLLIGYLLMSFTKSIIFFYIARFLCGIATGGICNLIPVYIGEIASSHNRGALSSLFNVHLCAGMVFTFCVGPYLSVMTFNMILVLFPALFLVLFFVMGPETAYYHIQKGEYDLARGILQKVRGSTEVNEELEAIRKQIEGAGTGSFLDIFKSKTLKKALFIALGLMVFQQLSGILAIFNYAQNIFEQAKVDISPTICSIIIGAVQFATSFVTPLVIDRSGRKPLLHISSVGMVVSHVPLGVYCYLNDHHKDVSSITVLPIICLMLFIATYTFGFGSLPWTIMGELFPPNVKSPASLCVTFFSWAMAFVVTKYFKTITNALGMGVVFWIFATSCAISIPFTHFIVTETKGKSLREIQEELES